MLYKSIHCCTNSINSFPVPKEVSLYTRRQPISRKRRLIRKIALLQIPGAPVNSSPVLQNCSKVTVPVFLRRAASDLTETPIDKENSRPVCKYGYGSRIRIYFYFMWWRESSSQRFRDKTTKKNIWAAKEFVHRQHEFTQGSPECHGMFGSLPEFW